MRALTDLGMSPSTIKRFMTENPAWTMADLFFLAVDMRENGIDLNAESSNGWKTAMGREEERKRQQAFSKAAQRIERQLETAYRIAGNGSPDEALKALGSLGKSPKPQLSLQAVKDRLGQLGVAVRTNVISGRIEFSGVGFSFPALSVGDLLNTFPVVLKDELQDDYKGVTLQSVTEYIGVIADESRYNPILEYIRNAPSPSDYSAVDTLIAALGIENDDFAQTLLMKWLYQGIALLHNREDLSYSADGILVLNGPQGCGKTSFARIMGMKQEWTLLGAYLDTKDKDTLIRTTGYFVTELGELETTFRRSDIERMKSFITASTDTYRKPYAKGDTIVPRKTSIVATCNTQEFLSDPTGSRRFWVIDCGKLDMKKLETVDALAVWRIALEAWEAENASGNGGTCYRLTAEERSELESRNAPHKKPVKAQEEIEDIFSMVAQSPPGTYEWEYITVSEFMEEFPVLERRHFTNNAIGRALDVMGYEKQAKKIEGKVVRVRYLPRRV